MFVPLTPLRCLHRAVDLFGSKIGVVSGDRQFTYAQLGDRAERLATALPKYGVAAGDRVAYLSFNNHQLLEGYYGVVQARAIVMPLNVRLSETELTTILCHSGAKMLMFENDFAPMIAKLRKSCPAVERWVTLDAKIPEADFCYEELIDQGHAERADVFSYDEMSIAELFYTSGSTGTPKGVTLAHRTLYVHALDIGALYKNIETMVDLHTIPMFHANGWGRPQASTLQGIKQVMVRRFEPTFVFRLIQEHKATDMCLVPTMANALINAPDRTDYDLSSMQRVMIGGAASSPELVDRVEKGHSQLRMHRRIWTDGDESGAHVVALEGAALRFGRRAPAPAGNGGMADPWRESARGRFRHAGHAERHEEHRRSDRDGRPRDGRATTRSPKRRRR